MPDDAPATSTSPAAEATARQAIDALDTDTLTTQFRGQDEFLFLDHFLPAAWPRAVADKLGVIAAAVHRNYIPRHKKGGSVSRYQLDELAPEIPALYHDKTLRDWLETLTGETLVSCPESDAHAYALYFYTEAGDHIGWHFDTSYYAGRRYTLLIGIIDESASKLEFELYRNRDNRDSEHDSRALGPGALCFFNGDKVYHRITPLGDGQRRVSLTFEFVTDPRMGRWQRFVSNVKDSIAYFGFRQAFSRSRPGAG